MSNRVASYRNKDDSFACHAFLSCVDLVASLVFDCRGEQGLTTLSSTGLGKISVIDFDVLYAEFDHRCAASNTFFILLQIT